MTNEEIRAVVARILGRIAPEADLNDVQPHQNWREQLDIDSMDFLNFIVALSKELQINVPETDYPKLITLHGCIDYLASRFAKPS